MYYDDEARRFNFLSGLLLGAVLGAGLALVAGPPRRRKPRRIRGTVGRLGVGARRLGAEAREAARSRAG